MMKNMLLLIPMLLVMAACGPKHINFAESDALLPKLTVQGDATIEAVPDQLSLRLGVVTQSDAAETAMLENNQRMSAVMAQLKELGLAEGEMSTGQFRVNPQWSQPPRPTPANWQRQIVGYQVSNELLIETTQVDLAGKLLALTQQAGANQIGGLQFGLVDPTEYRQQAIEKAVAKAIRKAETMAAAAGVELGALQSISLDSPGGAVPRMMRSAEMAMSSSLERVPVTAGRVEVSAEVSLIYRLVDKAAK